MTARRTATDRKAEIPKALLDLAFEVGPNHVTTGLIAQRLGLTQPAIYKHYPKKHDIWLAASKTLCQKIRENTQQTSQNDLSPIENLRQLFLGHLQVISKTPALPEIMVSRDPTGTFTPIRRAIQTEVGLFRAALTQCFEAAQTAGHFRANLPAADGVTLLLGIIQSLALRLISSRDTSTLIADGKRLFDLQISLLCGDD